MFWPREGELCGSAYLVGKNRTFVSKPTIPVKSSAIDVASCPYSILLVLSLPTRKFPSSIEVMGLASSSLGSNLVFVLKIYLICINNLFGIQKPKELWFKTHKLNLLAPHLHVLSAEQPIGGTRTTTLYSLDVILM